MSRIGVIGITDGWSSQKLVSAFQDAGCETLLFEMDHVHLDLEKGRATHSGCNLSDIDAIVVKKISRHYAPDMMNRLDILRYIASTGPAVFSDPTCMLRVIDRMSCTITLRSNQIPIPPTIITTDLPSAIATVKEYGSAVLKPLLTSKGRGMVVVDNPDDAETQVTSFCEAGHQMIYVQKLLKLPGQDLGLVFLGGKYLGCYARVAADDSWNTTIHSGGRYEKYEPDPAIIDLAYRAQKPFGLAFTCVDVAETESGPVVFEVSAFGGFRGLWESQGIDAANEYARFVLSEIRNGSHTTTQ